MAHWAVESRAATVSEYATATESAFVIDVAAENGAPEKVPPWPAPGFPDNSDRRSDRI